MEYLGTAVATWALNKLLDKLKDVTIKAVLGSAGIEKEVGDLTFVLVRANLAIGVVLAAAAASGSGVDDKLVEPINEMHRLVAKLTNYLDKLEYECIKAKVKARNLKDTSPITFRVSNAIVGEAFQISKSDMGRIKVIVEHLHQNCTTTYEALNVLVNIPTEESITDARETTKFNTETKVCPREESKSIQELITENASSEELLVLPIVGDGGVGKTTLARQVYNDQSGLEFTIKIWVYVSANFDEVKITQGILEQIPECKFKNTKNLNVLQDSINKHLTKRFILVLDDMWEEDKDRWDKLLAPLRFTKDKDGVTLKGNVILVTTRKLSVAKVTSRMEKHINLGAMKQAMFFLFFKKCIFGNETSKADKKLLSIGMDIAIKLNGNPLAAKTMGALLRGKLTSEYWTKISDSDLWNIGNKRDGIIPALRLSYRHLSSGLQLLFSYCALFPKGYKFDKEQLIRMWISLGLVTDKNNTMEDAGSDSFDYLVDGSFFQRDEQYFVMHDLIHDVAHKVSESKCLAIHGSEDLQVLKSRLQECIRHVSIWTELIYKEEKMECSEHFEDMLDKIEISGVVGTFESLMLVGVYDKNFSDKFLKTLKKLKYIRLLRLSAMSFNAKDLLSSVKNFFHLRYLEIRSTSDVCESLPEDICKLYHLMVLDIIHWRGLDDLPKSMHNLVNLRYLLVPEPGSLHSKISKIGALEFLQELKEFRVKKQSEFNISQLGSLNEIKGSLCILDLENATKKEASLARIKDKKYVSTLSLSWGSAEENPTGQKEVIDGLKPHFRLSHLSIINYAGGTPSWMGDDNFAVNNLESIQLQNCTTVETLPSFQKLQFLKKLSLIGLSSLEAVNIKFKSDDDDDEEVELSEVRIENCSALISIELHFSKVLTRFDVKYCAALSSIDGLDQQKHYDIQGCPNFPLPVRH